MAAPVRIEARAWSDIRFVTLARILRLVDSDHALIKVARLWSWQTEHFASDRPTYVLDADTIESVLGIDGPAALVRARLASEVAGGYRLHGTEGQIEWCEELSSKRQHAGQKRAAGAKRDARGRLMPRESGEPDNNQSSTAPARIQQLTSTPPAQSSAPDPTPAPDPENRNPPTPRATPPATDERQDTAARSTVRAQVRAQLEAARSRAGAARKVAVQPLLAFDRGLDVDLTEQLTRAPTYAALVVLADQARHAIAMAELEVTHGGKSFEWFTGAIFSGGNFPRLVGMTAADAKRPPKPATDPARRFGKSEPTTQSRPEFPEPPPSTDLTVDERLAMAAESRALLAAALADNTDDEGDSDAP
jgi:hypothetical protein